LFELFGSPSRVATRLGCVACITTGQSNHIPTLSCQGQNSRGNDEADAKDRAFWLSGSAVGSSSTMSSKYDLYGGVIIDPEAVPKDAETFRKMMKSSMMEWTHLKKRGVWLHLNIESSDLIPIATSEFGFQFHHAEKDHVMLTKWLPEDETNTLPSNASHTVGVGVLVTDSKHRVLLVREKTGPAAKLGIWKIPTGLVDAGEELHDAALRELKEETGIHATFSSIGAFAVHHGGNLAHAGKSNVFFIVKCFADSTSLSAQETEISEARWFTMGEMNALEFPQKDSLWHSLNMSALQGNTCIGAKHLSYGKPRADRFGWFYYPKLRATEE
jgi:ADP-ribose pyrophosphatase YjhB (NUDIX family)